MKTCLSIYKQKWQIAQHWIAHMAVGKTWQPANVPGFLLGHRVAGGDGGCGRPRWPRLTVTTAAAAERSLSTWPAPGKQKIIIIMQVSAGRGVGVFNGCRPTATLTGSFSSDVMRDVTRDVAIAGLSTRFADSSTRNAYTSAVDFLTCCRHLLTYLLTTFL